jgi:hypothetical protein
VKKLLFPVLVFAAALLALSARATSQVNRATSQVNRASSQVNTVRNASPLLEKAQVTSSAAAVTLEWYNLTLDLVRHTATYSPPVASRTFGYIGVTLFEIAAARGTKLRSLKGQLNGFGGVPQPVAGLLYDDGVIVQGALANTVARLFSNTGPTGLRALASVTARLEATVSKGVPEDAVRRSLEYGKSVSDAVLNWAATDGGAKIDNIGFPLSYPKASSPAAWVPTAALGMQQTPLLPNWGSNRPFAMPSGSSCALSAPPAYSPDKNSPFYKEALEVYDVSKNLTLEQREIAAFWDDSAMLSMTPPGHWIGILTQIFTDSPTTFERMAEGYARLGMAVADAFIGCWNAKFEFNLLRPQTYIQRVIDPKWTATLITPPFPEYPSGHSTQSGAAATVLTAFLGANYAFTDRTHIDDGLEARQYKSIWDAANEAGLSRLYGGIHFRAAIERGLEQGRCVGAKVNGLQFYR